MLTHLPLKRISPIASALSMTLLLAACGGDDGPMVYGIGGPGLGAGPQAVECKDYDSNPVMVLPKTITVVNNSGGVIYPVIATSKNAVNEWLQGCRRTTDAVPTEFVYKLYVNEGTGLPANSSVTLTLPLYSQLASDRYITWWNGGRVLLADRNDRLSDESATRIGTPDTVTCHASHAACSLTTYASDVQFPENVYAQLSEYTFGDSIIPAGQSLRLLKPENVGYNISYVDHVYMPVAIGLRGNPYIGYSGSVQPLAPFKQSLKNFLASDAGQGWPVYNLNDVKLPGGYNIFAQRSGTLPPQDNVPVKPAQGFPPVLTVQACIDGQCNDEQKAHLHFGEAVQRMQNLWGSCVAWNEDLSPYVTQTIACPQDMRERMEVVKQFFIQNHKNYLQLYAAGQCKGSKPEKPEFNFWEAMMHIYGWVPFNEGCGAGANKLADTQIPDWDHGKLQSMYIHELQYNQQQPAVKADPKLTFNPYVKLVHDDLGMNAYAFSVDDAVGFMSELGDGLVFTVGGPQGLENEKQFSYADGFTLNMGPPKGGAPNKAAIKSYGVCAGTMAQCAQDMQQNVVMPDDSEILGFRVGTVASYPVVVRFTDLDDNVYTVPVMEKFAPCPKEGKFPCERDRIPNAASIMDLANCSVHKGGIDGPLHPNSGRWCAGVSPNEQKEGKQAQVIKNFLTFPVPVDSLP